MSTDKPASKAKGIVCFRARDSKWQAPLSRLTAERATANFVWIKGERRLRNTLHVFVASSFGEAKDWLLRKLDWQIEVEEHHLSQLKERRAKVEATTETEIVDDNDTY